MTNFAISFLVFDKNMVWYFRESSARRQFSWNIMPYLLFLKKQQNLKLSSAANCRWGLWVKIPFIMEANTINPNKGPIWLQYRLAKYIGWHLLWMTGIGLRKHAKPYEPWHVISNNVVFWQVMTQTSLSILLLSLETLNDVQSVA